MVSLMGASIEARQLGKLVSVLMCAEEVEVVKAKTVTVCE